MTGGISVAWLEETHSLASSVMARTWRSLRSDPQWSAWLGDHTAPFLPFTVINVEERRDARIQVRGGTLSYFVPMGWVRAAHEARTLVRFSADLFRDVYVAWASRRELPMPPEITDDMLAAVPARLP
jgi:hypothetical protein